MFARCIAVACDCRQSMANTHYYALVGDTHVRGIGIDHVDPILGQRFTTLDPPVTTPPIGTILTGATSGARAMVRKVQASGVWILRVLDLNPFQWIPGEVVNLDNGTTCHASPYNFNAAQAPADKQFLPLHKDERWAKAIPADLSDTPYWDAKAKLAQSIRVPTASVAGVGAPWKQGDRFSTSGGGAFTLQHYEVDGADLVLYMVRKSGSIAATQTITNTTTAGTGTISVVNADPPVGTWVPFHSMPALNGQAVRYEIDPDGQAAFLATSVGPENHFLHAAKAYHGSGQDITDFGVRLIQHWNLDDPDSSKHFIAGVTVQTIVCTGTFPTTWVVNEFVTAGSYVAKVYGYNATDKHLYVFAPNGQTLAAGTITGSTSGAVATASGPAYGWQPGSKYFNDFLAVRTTAQAAPGALYSGQAAKFDGLALFLWETEILTFAAGRAPWPTIELMQAEWLRMIAGFRTALGVPNLRVALWSFNVRSHLSSVAISGFPFSYALLLLLDSLPGLDPNVVIVRSADQDLVYPLEDACRLTPDAYAKLGDRVWRALAFKALSIASQSLRVMHIGLLFGTSQCAGNIGAGVMQGLDRDPDLWPSGSFGVGVSTIDPNVLSFNCSTEEWEPWDVTQNSNTFHGSFPGTCGYEVPIVQRSKMRWSKVAGESAPFGFIKLGANGSCISAEVDNASSTWDPDLSSRQTLIAALTASVIPVSGMVPVALIRLTGPAGTFSNPMWRVGLSTTLAGSVGLQGINGNNTRPYDVNRITAIAPNASYIEVIGNGFAESATFTITAGPPPLWPEAERLIQTAIVKCAALNLVPYPAWIVADHGDNDLGFPAFLEAGLQRLMDAVESVFGLRAKGLPAIPKVIVQLTSQTPFQPDNDLVVSQARASQAAVAGNLENAVVVDTSDLAMEINAAGTWPRQHRRDNGVHRTARAIIQLGFRIDEALGTLETVPAHPNGTAGAENLGVGADLRTTGAGGASLRGEEPSGGTDPLLAGGGSASLTASPAQVQALSDALNESPDVAAWTDATGTSVTRRTIPELLALDKAQRFAEGRRAGIRRTIARFE